MTSKCDCLVCRCLGQVDTFSLADWVVYCSIKYFVLVYVVFIMEPWIGEIKTFMAGN